MCVSTLSVIQKIVCKDFHDFQKLFTRRIILMLRGKLLKIKLENDDGMD